MEKELKNNITHSTNKLGTAPLLPLLIRLAIPAMISSLALAAYNIIDSVFVSGLNQQALTGMYIISPIELLISALSIGSGIGASSCVSRLLGKKEHKQAKVAAFDGLFLGAVVWAVFAIIGFIFADVFVSCFTKDSQVAAYAVSYMKIICLGSGSAIITQIGFSLLQSVGQMIIPMIVQIACVIINAILDPFLIFGIGFFPKLEVAGAAYSTVFSQIISMVFILIIVFSKRNKPVNLNIHDFIIDKKIVVEIVRVGFSACLTQIIGSIMTFMLNRIIGTRSPVAIAAYGIYNKVFSVLYLPVFGIVSGGFPILGYSVGAKNYDRFKKTIIYSSLIGGISMLVGTAIFWIFSGQIISLFNPDAELMEMTLNCFRIMSITFVITGISIPISTSFNAAGKSFLTLSSAIFRQLVVIIPLVYVFANYISVNSAWWAFPIGDVVNFIYVVLVFIIYLRKRVMDTPKLNTN